MDEKELHMRNRDKEEKVRMKKTEELKTKAAESAEHLDGPHLCDFGGESENKSQDEGKVYEL